MALIHAEPKRFTVAEFTRLWELGAFGHERMELIEGEIVRMTPQGNEHVRAIVQATEVLVLALHDTHYVAVQVPLKLSEYSGPEPDFYLSPKAQGHVEQITPELLRNADLVIELSASSLAYDLDEKASLYAKYAIKDYWVLDVIRQQMTVMREPVPMPDRTFEHGYAAVTVHGTDEAVSPLVRPDLALRVADLL